MTAMEQQAAGNMQRPVSWVIATKVWWAFTWRSVLLAGAAGLAIGFALGVLAGLTGNANAEWFQPLCLLAGAACGVAAGIYAMQNVLAKKFKGFRVVIEKSEPKPETTNQDQKT